MENVSNLKFEKTKNDLEFLGVKYSPRENTFSYNLSKRVIDIFLSSLLLILLLPAIIFIAIAIKIDSPGPIIFRQKRVGKNQKIFTMYKFRTMVDNAEDIYKEILEKKIKEKKMIEKNGTDIFGDLRVTKIGRLLRKFSIDEMPQFINVIKGDMSLVGPRPNLPYELEQFDKEWYRMRYVALPGLSGLWQVSGRSRLTFEKMMELDYEYVMNRSLLMDFKIAIMTIPAVFRLYEAG